MSRQLSREIERKHSRIGRNIDIALRAQRVIGRRRMAVTLNQAALFGLAVLIAGIGLVMVNVALFFWLSEAWGRAPAGGVIALGNLALAAVLVLVASKMSVETELEPVIEVRDMAIEDIEAEVTEGVAEVKALADDIRGLARDPLGAASASLLGPLVSLLVSSLKK